MIDAQSTGRVEYLDPRGDPFTAAFRAQETLTAHVAGAMVSALNRIGVGPVLDRPFDCAVSTGDNIDNCQTNELEWFLTALDGGTQTANSGNAAAYEGVQASDWTDERYWHPDGMAGGDRWTQAGYPLVPGMLAAAITPFDTPSLPCPWYSAYGNHDGLIQGNVAAAGFDALLTGVLKVESVPDDLVARFVATSFSDPVALAADIAAGVYPTRTVTADRRRHYASIDTWVDRHLASPSKPGPSGHGLNDGHRDAAGLFYAFDISPEVLGIVLDTGGFNSGSIGETQLTWLIEQLAGASSRYFDEAGVEVRTGATDRFIVLFSHFPASSLTGSPPDPSRPGERRVLGPELEAALHRFPNVIAWINGHHHTNRIEPRPDPAGRGAYWDINTCAHVDWPQQSRIVEIADNADGTLSIFCTLVDHAGPITPSEISGPVDMENLASWSRELAANDPQSDRSARLGPIIARNVELAIRHPFPAATAATPTTSASQGPPAPPATPHPAAPRYTG